MSPTMKKILLIGGAAVAGYVVYTRFAKKPAPTTTLATSKVAQLTGSRLAMLKTMVAPAKTAGWY